jgi:nucleotide-binding universal stress UspA family protein
MTSIVPLRVSFREILVASDMCDVSENALRYAKAIAKRFGSHMVLAHVSDPVNPVAIPEGGWIVDNSAMLLEKQVEAAGIALRAEGFSADAVNAYGSVKDEIQALAEAHHADLIVMGTHGRRGLNRLLFGSEAEGLIRRSNRPVLTIGPSAGQPADEAWTPKTVLCATSLNPRGAKVVACGYRLAQSLGAAFALLSVDDGKLSSDDEQTWRAFENALVEAMPEEDVGRHQIRSLLSGRSPADNIVDVARTLKPDLIVMGARNAIFDVTHLPAGVLVQVLVDAPCPVLTISSE